MDTPATMSREEYLCQQLLLLHAEIGEAAERGSWQAVINGRRLASQMHTEIVALRAEQAPGEVTSIEDVVTELLSLPDAVFTDPRIADRVAQCS